MRSLWVTCLFLVVGCSTAPRTGNDGGNDLDGGGGPYGLPAQSETPVVVRAQVLSALVGQPANQLAAFRYANGAWEQVPLQVDERTYRRIDEVYASAADVQNFFHPSDPDQNADDYFADNWAYLSFYADPHTFVGADPDPSFDADDELAFMARDLGEPRPAGSSPTGYAGRPGAELRVREGQGALVQEAYLYIFSAAAPVDASAGRSYVQMGFSSQAHDGTWFGLDDYLSKYVAFGNAPSQADANCRAGKSGDVWQVFQPEDSTVSTSRYQRHFSGRWLEDALRISSGADAGSYGPNILDIHQNRFRLDTCIRSVYSFSGAEGALLTLKSGPVRALRSYWGANSGVFTQRTHAFYEDSETIDVDLRVHRLGQEGVGTGVMDLFQYSAAASGMRYHNASTPDGGLLIDGVPDAVVPDGGFPFSPWEAVSGSAQGSVLIAHALRTSNPELLGSARTQFIDDAANPACTCSPDVHAYYGASGVDLQQPQGLGCTDPILRCPDGGVDANPRRNDEPSNYIPYLRFHRDLAYRPGAVSEADLAVWRTQTTDALEVGARSLAGGDFAIQAEPFCGDGVCLGEETSLWCPQDCPTP